jgi:hypothetical protein
VISKRDGDAQAKDPAEASSELARLALAVARGDMAAARVQRPGQMRVSKRLISMSALRRDGGVARKPRFKPSVRKCEMLIQGRYDAIRQTISRNWTITGVRILYDFSFHDKYIQRPLKMRS